MRRIHLVRKPNLDQLLAYMLPGEDGTSAVYREVEWFNTATIREAMKERLIKQHEKRPELYAITRRGYDALKCGSFLRYRDEVQIARFDARPAQTA